MGYNWAMWHVATTDEFDDWFSELDEDSQAEVIAKVELLKILGPKLARPHADTLKGSKHANMKELRADTASTVMRVALHSTRSVSASCWLPATNPG